LESDGSESFETLQLARADLDRFCQSLNADDEIAVEATGNSAWFRDQVLSCVGRVVMVNPKQLGAIRKSVNKTDGSNARTLAVFLSKDMLPETRAKSQAQSELASLTAVIKELDREIEGTAKTQVGYEELTSIKGVGPRAAAVFLPSIGNVDDFETADKLAAYFGIVPKVSQSNETDHRGRTTKRGNKLARTTLV